MSYTGLSFSSQPFVKGFIASLDDDTDFRLKLGPYTWRVHSQLISQESDFFRKLTTGDWKESTTHTIELHDDEPWMIARMLQYFYYKQYDYEQHGPKNKRAGTDPTSITLEKLMSVGRQSPTYEDEKAADAKLSMPNVDLHMYIVADKYGATNIKMKILGNFGGQGKIGAVELMGICDGEEMKGVISRDHELKRAVAGKVARCYKDTVGLSKERPMDEWLLSDPQLCLLALEQMSAPNF